MVSAIIASLDVQGSQPYMMVTRDAMNLELEECLIVASETSEELCFEFSIHDSLGSWIVGAAPFPGIEEIAPYGRLEDTSAESPHGALSSYFSRRILPMCINCLVLITASRWPNPNTSSYTSAACRHKSSASSYLPKQQMIIERLLTHTLNLTQDVVTRASHSSHPWPLKPYSPLLQTEIDHEGQHQCCLYS